MRTARVCCALLFCLASSRGVAEDKTLNPTVVEPKPAADARTAEAAPAAAAGGGGDLMVCTQGKEKRTLEITYGDATTKLPCEVHYKKVTEDPNFDQKVYDAKHDVAFCQSKEQKFAEKLTGLGWTCGKGG